MRKAFYFEKLRCSKKLLNELPGGNSLCGFQTALATFIAAHKQLHSKDLKNPIFACFSQMLTLVYRSATGKVTPLTTENKEKNSADQVPHTGLGTQVMNKMLTELKAFQSKAL